MLQKAMIAASMGFTADIPPGLQTDYMDILERNYIISRDWMFANKNAVDQLKRSWKETNVNGFKEIMWMPPDGQMDPMLIKESIMEDVTKLFEAQYKDFNYNADSLAPFYFELMKSPTEQVLSDVGVKYAENKQIHIKKIDSDGNEVPGILLVRPDSDTAFPEPGKPASYSLQFLPDNSSVPQLIYEPDEWSNARFYLPVEKALAMEKTEKERMKAKQIELEAKAVQKILNFNEDMRIRLAEGLFSE